MCNLCEDSLKLRAPNPMLFTHEVNKCVLTPVSAAHLLRNLLSIGNISQ